MVDCHKIYADKIRNQDPLKQGLKPTYINTTEYYNTTIRNQDPLKQGLKQELVPFTMPIFVIFEIKIH